MLKFPLRTDEYGRNFYTVQNGALQLIPYMSEIIVPTIFLFPLWKKNKRMP